jgi:putative DNA methylase
MTIVKKKLIEVAIPLETINRESAREKLIRFGHPATMHLWWARRPLAACRAVIFAQLVDDPSSNPSEFPTEESQTKERLRLFQIIEKLVVWENTRDKSLLKEAQTEILKSMNGEMPTILDPFAGGGSIPLEALRLGVHAQAGDLNPVAVLLNKSLIEIPSRWADSKPVFPHSDSEKLNSWTDLAGLADDIRSYSIWINEEAKKSIAINYPQVALENGELATAIAWIWARTMTCPNPGCGIEMPLVKTFWLSKKKNREIWIEPIVEGKNVKYKVITEGKKPKLEYSIDRTGAICVGCGTPVTRAKIREYALSEGLREVLMAVVVEGNRKRDYVEASAEQLSASEVIRPTHVPEAELANYIRDFPSPNYGLKTFASLFTNRQLKTMTVFSDLVSVVHDKIVSDSKSAGMSESLAKQYAKDLTLYLGLVASRMADRNSNLCTWQPDPKNENARQVFSRQALSMSWDFAEINPFGSQSGNYLMIARAVADVVERLPCHSQGEVFMGPAQDISMKNVIVTTDPPYYDNIGYADLSDFFYVWLRRSLSSIYPVETSTILTPKAEELTAMSYRYEGGKDEAEKHFEDGFVKTFTNIAHNHPEDVPICIFYAFKQSEEDESGTASTGWETMLNGLVQAGLTITATWPIRTEMASRMVGKKSNVLASSIVLACRKRSIISESVSRRTFINALKSELPDQLTMLQQGDIAPVDLAQAAIGPGMAVFTRYAQVTEADGSQMSVRTALAIINQILDEVLSEQEGDFDPETRFCIKWFSQYGWNEAVSGEADILTRAVNTSVAVLERGGIFSATGGKARLLSPESMTPEWDPSEDKNISIWEVVVRVAHSLQTEGLDQAAIWMKSSSTRVDMNAVKELSYLMYSICEKKGWAESAILFNGLGSSLSDLRNVIATQSPAPSAQQTLEF